MGVDLSAVLDALPPSVKIGANIVLFLLMLASGGWALKKGHRDEDEREAPTFDASTLLERSPIKAYLEAVQVMADHAKLQTEGIKTISAALVAIAKLVESDFDERRIQREVERRTREMSAQRQTNPI